LAWRLRRRRRAIVNNSISQIVEADILASDADDPQGAQGVTAGGAVLLTATDAITSTADATAASIAISGGLAGASFAIAAAQATNTLAGTTAAVIDDSHVRANSGALTVSANSESQLFATPDAYAISASAAIASVAVAGAGASGSNTVTRTPRPRCATVRMRARSCGPASA